MVSSLVDKMYKCQKDRKITIQCLFDTFYKNTNII